MTPKERIIKKIQDQKKVWEEDGRRLATNKAVQSEKALEWLKHLNEDECVMFTKHINTIQGIMLIVNKLSAGTTIEDVRIKIKYML